ncbi:hypothetical protein [Methanoculleus taiwanensis]|uniref:hypothetical protein n=1 Tax=Methanoculleus taiwanensis TaxID=1550565 RepID=UPI000FFEA6FD|nr:hypothetical protein [Methanoculleus taiwanensis]
MEQHDPYGHVINYLGLEYNTQLTADLSSQIAYVQRTFFASDFISYAYSDPIFQAAYLMAYYPLYIDPIEDVLLTAIRPPLLLENQNSVGDKLGWKGRTNLDVSIYGGGAEPELLGLLKFIGKKYPSVKSVRSHYVDNNNWEDFRAYAYEHMVPDYWKGYFISGNTLTSNLGSIFGSASAVKLLQNSDVHVMQNCATDLMYSFQSVDQYVNFMCQFFDKIKEGSILIGIDVPLFDIPLLSNPSEIIDVRGSFNRICRYIRASPEGEVIKSPSTGAPKEIAPDIYRGHQLASNFSLKRTVKYHSFVARKIH